MNFVFLISQNLTKRNYERYGIKHFKKNKINLIILDLTNLFNNKINKISSGYEKLVKYENLHKINNYSELFLFLLKQNSFYFINACSYNSLALALIEKIIILKGNKKIHFSTALVPKIFRNYYFELTELIKDFKILTLIKKLINFSKNNLIKYLQPTPDVAFVSGKSELNNFNYKKTEIVKSNCLDYNKIINLNKKKIKKNFIVFLDENVPNHPDFHILGMKMPYSRKEYWSQMKLIFEKMHKFYNKKIIICLHPKNTKKDISFIKKFFRSPKYKIIQNKTLESVSESFLVLAHFSTSIQFAISLKKNLALISLTKFNLHQKKCISFYSEELKIPIIDNSNFNFLKIFNKRKYNNFFKKYICAYPRKNNQISWIKIINYCKSNQL